MVTLEEILRWNGQEFRSVEPDSDPDRMISQLCESPLGGVLIVKDGILASVVSTGDYLRKVPLVKRPFDESPLREAITRNLIATSPELIIGKCLALTREKHVCHLPVVFDDRLLGIVSTKDLARVIPKDAWS